MFGLLGKKVGMTQIFNEDGNCIPVTVLEAGPCWVVQKKEEPKDGYNAIQIGYGKTTTAKVGKPRAGHLKKLNLEPLKHLREIRGVEVGHYEVGQEIRADIFKAGDLVDVVGVSRGKGFAGGVKRWGYGGGADTHGSMFHRAPGSIGASSYPSRVFKGRHMPGQMGNERVTVKNLMVLRVDKDKNILLVKGAVPGSPDGLVLITHPLSGKKG